MSSDFEKMFLFLLIVISLLSGLDKIDVRIELLADDVWESEDDKTSFFNVGVDNFDRSFFVKRPISFPMVQNSTDNQKYDKWE